MIYAKPVIQSFEAEALEQEIEAGASCTACMVCTMPCTACTTCILCEYIPLYGADESKGWDQDFDAEYV